jgi:hypothetical protein
VTAVETAIAVSQWRSDVIKTPEKIEGEGIKHIQRGFTALKYKRGSDRQG